jgi:uncharacterized membrane protein
MGGTPRLARSSSIRSTPLAVPVFASTVLVGLAAGFFFAYSANVVLALGTLPGSTYTSVMQPINESVRNAAFAVVFFGTVVVSALGVVAMSLRRELATRHGLLFLGGAVVYLIGTVAVTATVHVPMNEYIATWSVADPPADWVAVRARWARWNLVRTVAAGVSFVLYLATVVALVGRSGREGGA